MQDSSEKKAWQQRWDAGLTGWDQGEAHPSLAKLLKHATREGSLPEGARIYSAGAGRAHSEAALARLGYVVKAVDLSDSAIQAAKSLYGEISGLHLAVGDFNDIPEDELASFDAIYDRAMLCALGPGIRLSYIEAMKKRLKPGGLFCSILFRRVEVEKSPPYAIDEKEAYRVLGGDFELVFAVAIPAAPKPAVVKEEWISIWRRKD